MSVTMNLLKELDKVGCKCSKFQNLDRSFVQRATSLMIQGERHIWHGSMPITKVVVPPLSLCRCGCSSLATFRIQNPVCRETGGPSFFYLHILEAEITRTPNVLR